jgi:hypothetical protein
MLSFAHLGLTLAAGRFMQMAELAFWPLGSMLPDIIDKLLGLLPFGTLAPLVGRSGMHYCSFWSWRHWPSI